MMLWEIKQVLFKTNFLLNLNKGMQMERTILMLFLGDNILLYGSLLLQVL